jgi:hypothetical protein
MYAAGFAFHTASAATNAVKAVHLVGPNGFDPALIDTNTAALLEAGMVAHMLGEETTAEPPPTDEKK